jgi:hypothetical protein
MGFQRGKEKQYITGKDRNILDHYPEIAHFRDLVFMFKLVMVPTTDQLPELRAWRPEEIALGWGIDPEKDAYTIQGFNRSLCAEQVGGWEPKERISSC